MSLCVAIVHRNHTSHPGSHIPCPPVVYRYLVFEGLPDSTRFNSSALYDVTSRESTTSKMIWAAEPAVSHVRNA